MRRLASRLTVGERRARAGLVLAAVAVPAAVAAFLAERVAGVSALGADRFLLEQIDGFYGARAAYLTTDVLVRASIGAGALVAVSVAAVLALRRQWRAALFWALAIGGVLALEPLLKALVARPGIGQAADQHSFPSGNATASVAIVVAAVLLLAGSRWRRPVLAAGVIAVVAEGAGLVLLQWHYPTDVAGGWCVGLAWTSGLWLVTGRPAGHLQPRPGRARLPAGARVGPENVG